MTESPVFVPVRDLAARVRAREVSPVALAECFLDRIERFGPRYNAVVTVTRERAMASARRAEAEIAAGRYRGPLHGIPYGAKDLLATAGSPTTWGAAPLRAQAFDADATAIRKLDEAGAVLCAKLAMVELAGGMGYRQPNAAFTGPGINPWSARAWSGGSSSGSGSAVAAGLVPFALGSETWGSILGPAGYCGVAGLRPTHGRVSRHGAMTLCWTLDKIGPLALTADDCGLVLDALAGHDEADPSTARRPYRYDAGDAAGDAGEGAGRRFRWGVLRGVTDGCDADVRRSFEQALAVLAAMGTVEEVSLPDLPWEAATRTILQAEGASALEDLIESGAIGGLTAPEDRAGPYARESILAVDYIKALRLRGLMVREADRLLAGLDALVAPGRPTLAPPLAGEFRSATRGSAADPMGAAGNIAGLPAVVVPSGFGAGGLPTSIQFMGRAWEDDTVLAAARAYQARTDWHRRHPPVEGGAPR